MAAIRKKQSVDTQTLKQTTRRKNKEDFPRPLTTVDLAIFTVYGNELCVLLVERPDIGPYPNMLALPGGIVDVNRDSNLQECARRKLKDKTGVNASYLEQVGSWGDSNRDPRGWSTTHVYFALIPFVQTIELAEGSQWLAVSLAVDKNRKLAFDHGSLLRAAVARLQNKVEYTSLPAYLLNPPFTLPQLQHIYEIVLDRLLDKSSFRTRTLSANYLEEKGLMKVDATRPAMGYRIISGHPLVIFPRALKGAKC